LQAENEMDLSSVACSQSVGSFEPTSSPSSSAGTPTSLQPTFSPTESSTTSPEATTLRTLVCGMNNKCSADKMTAEKTTAQAVRCCRDESHGGSSGWPFKCRSDSQATYSSSSGPWGQSIMGIIPDNLVGSLNGNCVETDFDGAVKTCEENNARLCTPQEMSDRCTRGTGCNFNNRLVWTCTAGGDGCNDDAECCSGTCGADGTCIAVQQPTVQPTTLEPAPPTCTICDDKETTWQTENGFDCATDTVRIDKKCNKDAKWTEKGYCRLSCYNAGNGYPGDVCCDEIS